MVTRAGGLTKVTWVTPANHTDTVLVHNPAVSLDRPYQPRMVCAICRGTYDNPYANDSVEICKIPCDIVL